MSPGPHPVTDVLERRLPLTLLLDLLSPKGPDSQVLFLIEEPRRSVGELPQRQPVTGPVD